MDKMLKLNKKNRDKIRRNFATLTKKHHFITIDKDILTVIKYPEIYNEEHYNKYGSAYYETTWCFEKFPCFSKIAHLKEKLSTFVKTGEKFYFISIFFNIITACSLDGFFLNKKCHKNILDLKLDIKNVSDRQRLATLILQLIEIQQTINEQHADNKVEPDSLTSEDVHGNNDITMDIEDAPEREEADGEKNDDTSFEDLQSETQENKMQNDTSNETGKSETNITSIIDNMLTPTKEEPVFGGGGSSINQEELKTVPIKKELRKLFEKLAFEKAPYGKTDAKDHWDGRKLIQGRFAPNRIPCAKSGKEIDHNIYFVLDDSGSMWDFANMFKGLLEAAKHVVKVYTGSEAHPCAAVNGSYEADYEYSFLKNLYQWLNHEKPAPGSVLLFWGDTCDMNIRGEEPQVKKLLSRYRAYWLGTYQKYNYGGWEQPFLQRSGFKVISPVTTPQELRRAIKKIK